MKERKKVKRGNDEEVNGQGGRGVPRPHTGRRSVKYIHTTTDIYLINANCIF